MTQQNKSAGSSPLMLVVDDHDGMRASLVSWLAHVVPQCRLIEAASGEAAVQLVLAAHVDLVLMDISLPGISGIEAARHIKAASAATRVVMLTMHDGADYRAASAAAGASGFVFKGMMHQQLPPLIHTLLGAFDRDADGAFRPGLNTPPVPGIATLKVSRQTRARPRNILASMKNRMAPNLRDCAAGGIPGISPAPGPEYCIEIRKA